MATWRLREMRDLEAEHGSIMKLVHSEGSKEREFKTFQLTEIRDAALARWEEKELS